MSSIELPRSPLPSSPRWFFAASAAALFFAIWSFFVFRTEFPAFDRDCAEQGAELCQAHARSRSVMIFLTDLGGVAAMVILAVMGALWQHALNRRFLAYAWLAIVLGGGLLNVGVKHFFDRPRPPAELRDRAVYETNASYPSGHSMGSAVGYGMLAYALLLTQACRRRRIAMVVLLAGIVIAIGCSRFALRAHWFSDVVGGWAIGLAWLCFCLGLIERRRRTPV